MTINQINNKRREGSLS